MSSHCRCRCRRHTGRLPSHILEPDGRCDTNPLFREDIDQHRTRSALSLGLENRLAFLERFYGIEVRVKEIGRIEGATAGLRVELSAEYGTGFVNYA